MTLALIVLLPFLGALLPPLAERRSRRASAVAAVLPPLLALALLGWHAPAVLAGGAPTARWPWVPQLGLDVTFRLDGLAAVFALLVLGIGVLIVVYARYYLSERDAMGRFYAQLLLFMGAMTGLVLSGNLLLIVVFWELTSLASFLLIGFWTHRADARRGARMALTVTGLGGLALLGGMVLLGRIAGTYDLATVLTLREVVQADPRYPAALLLVLLGAFTKSAQFPFQFWLPDAMAAPTPVSAYLHSATMVKAGVFLLARLHPVLAGSELWIWLVGGTGLFTFGFAAYVAQFKHDLKAILAYSTISHLGLITMLLGIGSPLASLAAVFHILNHAAFKASLFMAAGIVDHETGTRDLRVLNGLWRYMPYTTALAVIAAAAMAGVPLFNGFLSKEMFFSEALAVQRPGAVQWLVPALATLGGAFSVSYSARFIVEAFFKGDGSGMPKVPHEPPRFMRVPVELLAVLCLVVGVFPYAVVPPLLEPAAAAVIGGAVPEYSLALWHGFSRPLLMTVIAFVGGVFLYVRLNPVLEARRSGVAMPLVSGRDAFEWLRDQLVRRSERVTRLLDTGSLQRYLLVFVLTAVALGAVPLLRAALAGGAGLDGGMPTPPVDWATAVVGLVLGAATLATVALHRDRFVALIVVGAVGLVVSLAFVHFAAPDLALTQLLVEVVTVLLLLLALYHLPGTGPSTTRGRRLRDAVVATAAGGGTAVLAWAMLTRPPRTTLADYFLAQSKPLGGGTNVVNVILVDFRGFDTLGEITVMGVAAIGVAILLEGLRARPTAFAAAPKSRDRHPLLLRTASRPLLPLLLLVALFLLLRGHNLPGGGFIAALLTASALMLQYMASGVAWTRDRLAFSFVPVIAAGIGIALATAAGALLFDAPFLSHTFTHLHLPLVGDVELATAMLFDLGVYVAVVGAVMVMLARLGWLSTSETPGTYRQETDPWRS